MAALKFKYKHHFDPKTPAIRDFDPEFDFMGAFLDGLNTVCARRTEDDLGDRSAYIGASDLNSNCIRKTVLEKREATNPKKIDFQQGIYYERGHLAEHILRKALIEQRIPHYYQPELIHPTEPWIIAHLDFMFVGPEYVLVNDMKTGPIPSGPDYWIRQLHLQQGLAKICFPAKKVMASVTVIDLTQGEVKQFNGIHYDVKEFTKSFKKAKFIKYVMENGGEDKYATQTPLCPWCGHMADCPKYLSGDIPEITDPETVEIFQRYNDAKMANTESGKTYDKLRKQMLDIVLGFGKISSRVKIDDFILEPKPFNRTTVDGKRLKAEEPEIYEQYSNSSASYKLSCVQATDADEKAA
jgi:CRISPR-associated exonuclease Cas4